MSSSEPTQSAEGATTKLPTKSSRSRVKPQLSCVFCRNRKLKCDRNLPCSNCTKRNLSSSCSYVNPVSREKVLQVRKTTSKPKDLQSQIQHLEDMVVSLMNKSNKTILFPNGNLGQVTPDTSPEAHLPEIHESVTEDSIGLLHASDAITAESFGRISLEDERPSYVGSSHWSAILNSIACLKDQLENTEEPDQREELPKHTGPDLLVGSVRAATKTEILAAVPSKAAVDVLVEDHFLNSDMGTSILHFPTFRKEYANFWADPHSVSVTWLGLLFSIICLATQFEAMAGVPSQALAREALRDPHEAINRFREKTVQALVLSNYTEPSRYTVETLTFYWISEHFRTSDTQVGGWMVFGLVVRAAMRLGLHRDPSHSPKISIFRGEMQRRLWGTIVHLDLQTSLQVGLPKMIRNGTYDTQAPSNLLDEDFDEFTTVLPPERSEVTAVNYANAKFVLTKVFAVIHEQANSINPVSYEEVMRLDKSLHNVYEQIHEGLKLNDSENLDNTNYIVLFRKYSVDLTFQKARCVLHRKYIVPTKSLPKQEYPYSTKACLDAAMRILEAQQVLHNKTQPGEPLDHHRWKTSSLLAHDFLLAAMLVCLYLSNGAQDGDVTPNSLDRNIKIQWTRDDMVHMLKGSYKIWEELSATSKEARKAARALKSMLAIANGQKKVIQASERRQFTELSTPLSGSDRMTFEPSFNTSGFQNSSAEDPSWIFPSYPAESQMARNTFQYADSSAQNVSADQMEIDWELWDTHFYHNHLVNTPPDFWSAEQLSLSEANPNTIPWGNQL